MSKMWSAWSPGAPSAVAQRDETVLAIPAGQREQLAAWFHLYADMVARAEKNTRDSRISIASKELRMVAGFLESKP
jgi:hypothetical protein